MKTKDGVWEIEQTGDTFCQVDDYGYRIEYEIDSQDKTIYEDYCSYDNLYTRKSTEKYEVADDLKKITIALMNATIGDPMDREIVKDGKLQENILEKRDKEKDLLSSKTIEEELKKEISGYSISFENNYKKFLFILEQDQDISDEDFRKLIREEQKKLETYQEKVSEYLRLNENYNDYNITESRYGTVISNDKIINNDQWKELSDKEKDEYWETIEKIESLLFDKSSEDYVGISNNYFSKSGSIIRYVDWLLTKPKSRRNSLRQPDIFETKRIKNNNNKMVWLNALLPTLFLAIIISWISDISFWGGLGVAVAISVTWELVKLLSSTVTYRIFGGRTSQIETFYTLMKTANLPRPDDWDIKNPSAFYTRVAEDEESTNNQIIMCTVFNTGVDIARSNGWLARASRLLSCHKKALKIYQKEHK